MAEVVGLVVGLASFGVQLIESTKKLKALCEDIRDAPVELQDTIDDIEIMSQIISLMAPRDGPPYAEGTVLARTIELCRKALDRLTGVTSDLHDRLQSSNKIRGRLSVVLKKDSMDRLIRRLERCKSLLELAHQLYMGALNMSRFDCQDRTLEELRNGQMTLVSRPMTKVVCQAPPTDEQQTAHVDMTEDAAPVPPEQHSSRRREATKPKNPVLSIRVRTPKWAFSRLLELTVAPVPAGWTASLQSYRVVDECDPFMEACRANNISVVKELLQARKATVHDFDPCGRSAIELAIRLGSFDVSKYLYEHGANPKLGRMLVYSFCRFYWEQMALNGADTDQPTWTVSSRLCRDALEQLGIDECDDAFHDPLVQLWVTPVESLSAGRRLELMLDILNWPRFHEISWVRMCNILQAIGGPPADPALVGAVAGPGESLFHVLATVFASGLPVFGSYDFIMPMTAQYISLGADLTARDGWSEQHHAYLEGSTPLGKLLSCLSWGCKGSRALEYDLILRHWVQMLASCGVDLMAYGASEAATKCEYKLAGRPTKRIRGIAYGPTPADWSVLFVAHDDCCVGEVWRRKEEPKRRVPGAWIEQDEVGENRLRGKRLWNLSKESCHNRYHVDLSMRRWML